MASADQLEGVPIRFADHSFSSIVTDKINDLISLPGIKELQCTDDNATQAITYEITEMLKRLVRQHIKENYKVIIQVITYPKKEADNILIRSECLWNYRTDDVLSVEMESDTLKFLIVIHGVVA